MSKLSLLMGLFLAVTVTGVVLLMAVIAKVGATTILFRGLVVFFIFGMLGTILGSFLEVVLMPATTEKETEKLKEELLLEDAQLRAELGDLLDEDEENNRYETFGTPTDEPKPITAGEISRENGRMIHGDSAAAS
ncbi:MAG: hypothetical protein Kow0029_22830 [Candidatus Rifleibacteriota bacterium]